MAIEDRFRLGKNLGFGILNIQRVDIDVGEG